MASGMTDDPGKETSPQRKAGTLQGLALALGSCLTVMASIALAPVLPEMMTEFRDVPSAHFWVPASVGVTGLGAALFAPFAGLIGDRFGRRGPLTGFCLLFSVAGALPVVLNDFGLIFLTRAVVGFAYMGAMVLSTALIGDYFSGESRGRWLAAQAIAASSSALLILPLSGFLGGWLGWRGPFLLFLLGLPFAAAYWLLFGKGPSAEISGPRAAWSALPWVWLACVCLVSVFSGTLFYAVQLQIGLALAAVGVADPARIGLFSGMAIAGIPVGAILFMKAVAYPFARLIRLELLIGGATLMMMRFSGDYRIFLFIAFAHLIACGMIVPTLLTHVTRRLDDVVRARGIGIWQAAFASGHFLSVGISGLVMLRLGTSILDAFWVLGAVSAAAAIISSLVARIRRKSEVTASSVA